MVAEGYDRASASGGVPESSALATSGGMAVSRRPCVDSACRRRRNTEQEGRREGRFMSAVTQAALSPPPAPHLLDELRHGLV